VTVGVLEDRIDSLDMFGVTSSFPEQVEAAAGVAAGVEGLPAHDDIDSVVILGMGGSGMAGDLAAAVSGPFSPVPIVVAKGYAPPNFVSNGTLAFAVSFSGDTEETLEAASAAYSAGAHVVTMSAGGQLAQLASEWGTPHVALPTDIPMPRAGLGAMSVPMLGVLERVGMFPGASAWVDAAIMQLKIRREAVFAGDSADEIARTIGRTIPLFVGAGPLGAVVARRWKAQVNENAKAPAFTATIPEMCHNEVAGWGQHGDMTRQVFTLVELRHDEEHPQESRRFDLVREMLDEVVHEVVEVRAIGEGALAQAFDLTLLGDFVSLHMAAHEKIDPGPVPVLEQLKAALAGP
jgi:glucose/mannose-6-phosphate isomerase